VTILDHLEPSIRERRNWLRPTEGGATGCAREAPGSRRLRRSARATSGTKAGERQAPASASGGSERRGESG
jgi:hypothetical protein